MTAESYSARRDERFPFSHVVGQDDAKLALLLLAVDPLIGGVLLRGEKGSAKTTLARGLAALLVDDAPFVELPLGATEDRLIGTLDLTKALIEGDVSFTAGILSDVDGGVLYVDEVNLLADHLVDSLLDVSVSGVNRVERDGVSHAHSAQFVLIGSMNPEEGELRPQLLDRFGLSVDIKASQDATDRAEAVRRRLRFDAGLGTGSTGSESEGSAGEPNLLTATPKTATPKTATPSQSANPSQPDIPSSIPSRSTESGAGSEEQLRDRLRNARPGTIPDTLILTASELALAVGAEGLRADLVLCRAAGALAGLDGRDTATEEDLRRVAPLVLAHRSRRNPFDPPMLDNEQLEQALTDVLESPDLDGAELDQTETDQTEPDQDQDSAEEERRDEASQDGDLKSSSHDTQAMSVGETRLSPMAKQADRLIAKLGDSPAGKRQRVESDRGRFVRDVAPIGDETRPLAVAATVRQLAARRPSDERLSSDEPLPSGRSTEAVGVEADDIRHAVKERKAGSLLVLAVDTSGSMGATERAELATGTAMGLLTDAYQRRDHVAVVTFSGDGAETILQPTGSVEVARNRLAELPSGGVTPLAEGIQQALLVIRKRRDTSRTPFCVFLTDGRASGDPEALGRALAEAAIFKQSGIAGMVLDCETDVPRLGLAQKVAEAMGLVCIDASELDSVAMAATIRSVSEGSPRVR